MKKLFFTSVILFSIFLMSAAQEEFRAPKTFTIAFDDGATLSLTKKVYSKLTTLNDMVHDLMIDDTTSIDSETEAPKHPLIKKCSKKSVEHLAKYIIKESKADQQAFLQDSYPEDLLLLLEAADYLNLSDKEGHVSELALYALTSLSLENLKECIWHIEESVIKDILKKWQLSALIHKNIKKRNLAHHQNLGKQKVAFLKEWGYWNFTISIKDLWANPETKYLLTPSSLTLNLSHRYITSLDGLNDVPSISSFENLIFDHNFIKTITASTFTNCLQLESLSLFDNKITAIEPESFATLPYLTFLRLCNNKLSHIDGFTFGKLQNLKRLLLGKNAIKTLTEDSFKDLTQLEILLLTHNKINALSPKIFTGLACLEELYLHHNTIKIIPSETLTPLSQLTILSLAFNKIKRIHPSNFAELSHLSVIDLKHNRFNKKQKYCIKKAKTENTKILF